MLIVGIQYSFCYFIVCPDIEIGKKTATLKHWTWNIQKFIQLPNGSIIRLFDTANTEYIHLNLNNDVLYNASSYKTVLKGVKPKNTPINDRLFRIRIDVLLFSSCRIFRLICTISYRYTCIGDFGFVSKISNEKPLVDFSRILKFFD